jgi:hypothetical protein
VKHHAGVVVVPYYSAGQTAKTLILMLTPAHRNTLWLVDMGLGSGAVQQIDESFHHDGDRQMRSKVYYQCRYNLKKKIN